MEIATQFHTHINAKGDGDMFGRGRRGGGFGRGLVAGAVGGALIRRAMRPRNHWTNARTRRAVRCFHCARMNNQNAHFCSFCGTDMFMFNDVGMQCWTCGLVCQSGWGQFCANCGDSLQ